LIELTKHVKFQKIKGHMPNKNLKL